MLKLRKNKNHHFYAVRNFISNFYFPLTETLTYLVEHKGKSRSKLNLTTGKCFILTMFWYSQMGIFHLALLCSIFSFWIIRYWLLFYDSQHCFRSVCRSHSSVFDCHHVPQQNKKPISLGCRCRDNMLSGLCTSLL